MSDIDRETRKAKRYEIGVHCSELCLGGRARLTETTDPDPFNEDVVMATDYDDLLTRYDRAIALLQEAVPSSRYDRAVALLRYVAPALEIISGKALDMVQDFLGEEPE